MQRQPAEDAPPLVARARRSVDRADRAEDLTAGCAVLPAQEGAEADDLAAGDRHPRRGRAERALLVLPGVEGVEALVGRPTEGRLEQLEHRGPVRRLRS